MNKSKRNIQFSIRGALLLIAFVAVVIVGWRNLIYRPPTHKIPYYERATPYRGISARIGPNTIRIKSIARNSHDGELHVVDGYGRPMASSVPFEQELKNCGPWLDVVQIELDPQASFDIQRLRIFNHERRELLVEADSKWAWRAAAPNVVQLFGLGKPLPQLVDIWFELRSYAAQHKFVTLAAEAGAKARLDGGTIMLTAMQNGFRGWIYDTGFVPVPGDYHNDCGVEIDCWPSRRSQKRYQLAAVKHDHRKQFERGLRDFQRKEVAHFSCGLNEVDHFEIRPFTESTRFFFERVPLPAATIPRLFDEPPRATIELSGQPIEERLVSDFLPLEVRIAALDGEPFEAAKSGRDYAVLIPRVHGVVNKGEVCTITLRSYGLPAEDFAIHVSKRGESPAFSLATPHWSPRFDSTSVNGRYVKAPISDLQEVHIELLP